VTKRKRKSTRTSAFGAPGRISHDSSDFYASRLYEDRGDQPPVEYVEQAVPTRALDQIIPSSAEHMEDLPDCSIHLMVTSPPYNVRKEYDEDLTLDEYLALLERVFKETRRVLVPGGRACVNLANLGRKPYLPLHVYVIQLMLETGFLMRGEIIWNKGSSASASTAWGSWMSATNPVLRDIHEYILIFSKDSFSRPGENKESTIRKEDFLDWTKSVWSFPAASARQIGHPAPFPEDLPRRLIELYSFRGDVVLDPFCGSGTTCLAAREAERHFVGYEIDPGYVDLARKRLETDQE
jgi:DNA modification methylase